MKLFQLSILLLFLTLFAAACGSDDGTSGGDGCFDDVITLTQTAIDTLENVNSIIVSFDMENTSLNDYNVNDLMPLYGNMVITTTDGTEYESDNILTVSSLSAGATTNLDVFGEFGVGKEYSSYTLDIYCP